MLLDSERQQVNSKIIFMAGANAGAILAACVALITTALTR